MNKLLLIVCIIFGFGLGFFVRPFLITNTSHNNIVSTAQNSETNQCFGDQVLGFFDQFPSSKDQGSPYIPLSSPDHKLLLIRYATSQESNTFGVIDYEHEVFHKNLFGSSIGGGENVETFVGSDKLLVTVSDSDTPRPTKIVVGDFSGNFVKELLILSPKQNLHEAYSVGNTTYITIDNDSSIIDNSKKTYSNYKLDSKTLEFVKI